MHHDIPMEFDNALERRRLLHTVDIENARFANIDWRAILGKASVELRIHAEKERRLTAQGVDGIGIIVMALGLAARIRGLLYHENNVVVDVFARAQPARKGIHFTFFDAKGKDCILKIATTFFHRRLEFEIHVHFVTGQMTGASPQHRIFVNALALDDCCLFFSAVNQEREESKS